MSTQGGKGCQHLANSKPFVLCGEYEVRNINHQVIVTVLIGMGIIGDVE